MRHAHAIHSPYNIAIVIMARLWLYIAVRGPLAMAICKPRDRTALNVVGQCERQLIMYLLDLCMSNSTHFQGP